ncbi:long-chain-fatty-acid--CoA ligase [Actinomadura sp. LOL_016]|uniref:long-chain-fatty-acid--CoA ligase n=1 Tax=unclassified Actinomadura TaxID=2626254 RepID=UPI003A813774
MASDQEMVSIDSARRMTIGEMLARAARRTPENRAYQVGERRVTYAEIDARVDRLARALRQRGVRKGDRVAVMLRNTLECVESFFAVCRLGAITVPVNFRLVAAEVAHILQDSGATALIAEEDLAPIVRTALADDGALSTMLVVGDPGDLSASARPQVANYENALAEQSSLPLVVDMDESDPAFIMYTSGTTGKPKGAVLTHRNLVVNNFNLVAELSLTRSDEVRLSGTALFHIAGLNGMLYHLMAGGCSIILETGDFDPVAVLDVMEREKVTSVSLVPTQWRDVCRVAGERERELSLRRMFWGTSSIPPSVLKDMFDTFPGVPVYALFGQTEMSASTCMLKSEDALAKFGSVGRPLVNVEARIVDDEMRDVADGEVGEIVYRGPTVFKEYWNNPEETAEVFAGGWFHSGDLCRRDEDGFVFVMGRKKEMIISGGENIYCQEVEDALDSHPKVAQVAVVGVPHEKWVETPCAVVVPVDPGDPPTLEEIVGHCRSRLASYKKPTRLVVVEEFPRNAAGKIQRFRLKEQLAAATGAGRR